MTLDTVVGIVGGGVFGLVLIGLLMVFRHAVSEELEDARSQPARARNPRSGQAHKATFEPALEPVRVRSAAIRAPGQG